MDRGRTALPQDVTQLINIGRTQILFDHKVFKTELLLKYNETLDNFCSTSLNPVFQSLKYVLTELSTQVTNFHSDINGHQKTSMYILYSNFCQINYNIVTVKNDFSRNTTVSDM